MFKEKKIIFLLIGIIVIGIIVFSLKCKQSENLIKNDNDFENKIEIKEENEKSNSVEENSIKITNNIKIDTETINKKIEEGNVVGALSEESIIE